MKLYVVRHAKSLRNGGREAPEDTPLSDAGMEQARRLGRYFENLRVDSVYCSPLNRARDTFEGIRPYLDGTSVTFSPDIVEHNMGIYGQNGRDDWEGYGRVANKSGLEFVKFKPEAGESVHECYERAGRFYEGLRENHSEDNILTVGHGMFSMHLLLNALGLPLSEGVYVNPLSNAGVSTLDVDEAGRVVHYQIDDCKHLFSEGLRKNGAKLA